MLKQRGLRRDLFGPFPQHSPAVYTWAGDFPKQTPLRAAQGCLFSAQQRVKRKNTAQMQSTMHNHLASGRASVVPRALNSSNVACVGKKNTVFKENLSMLHLCCRFTKTHCWKASFTHWEVP